MIWLYRILFLPLLLLSPLSVVVSWFAVRRGLHPLTLLQAQIVARCSANLTPLDVDGLHVEEAFVGPGEHARVR